MKSLLLKIAIPVLILEAVYLLIKEGNKPIPVSTPLKNQYIKGAAFDPNTYLISKYSNVFDFSIEVQSNLLLHFDKANTYSIIKDSTNDWSFIRASYGQIKVLWIFNQTNFSMTSARIIQ